MSVTNRLPIIAGNWKMYKTPQQAAEFARALIPTLDGLDGAERVVCPPFTALQAVHEALAGTSIKIGAQNVHWEPQGAFTSSISAPMLQGLVDYVLVGHSEVRQHLGETDEQVNRKVKALLAHDLKPIVAVGESLDHKQMSRTEAIVGGQVIAALDGVPVDALAHIVIAYEPIWAIGSGLAANAADANTVIVHIRGVLAGQYGSAAAQSVRIQYGGSVKPDNMADFMSYPDIDGALVGGASLKVDDFVALTRIAIEAKRGG